MPPEIAVRRTLRPGDAEAIAALHDRIYRGEYGLNPAFTADVAGGVRAQTELGWPTASGAVWLIEDGRPGILAGALALTRERAGHGRVRWFALEGHLRGAGLGRRLLDELLAEASRASLRHLELGTFSALTAAAHLYRTAGFRLISAHERHDWGPPITFQHYELELDASPMVADAAHPELGDAAVL